MGAFIEQMRPYGILELIRTGRIALTRSAAGSKITEAVGSGVKKLLAISC